MKQQAAVEIVVENDFKTLFRGKFYGVLRWHQLDGIWGFIKNDAKAGWYCYNIGRTPPETVMQDDALNLIVDELDKNLREKHKEDYCGIVYVDDLQAPTYIKVFDPKKMGTSCSIGTTAPLPEWIISKTQPQDLLADLEQADKQIKLKKRWLGNLFSK